MRRLVLRLLTAFVFFAAASVFAADNAVGKFVAVSSYAQNAESVAAFADNHIARLCAEFDYAPKQWRRTPVTIRSNRPGYGEGFAETVVSTEQYCGRVEISERFPEVLDHALPHELTHVWVAYSVRFPFSLFLNESLASSHEAADHVRNSVQRAATLYRALKLDAPFDYLNRNIALPVQSARDLERIREYYAAACSFASFCYELPGGKPNYLRFCSRLSGRVPVARDDFQKAILDFYGFTEQEFNAAFFQWVRARGGEENLAGP